MDDYTFEIEIPGVPRESVEITYQGRTLRLKAEKNERCYNKELFVPRTFDLDKTKVKLQNGVLSVTLIQAEDNKPKSIAIE